jgi:hypothetical protein
MSIVVDCPNVTRAILPLLATQLESHGAHITFDTPASGIVQTVSGRMTFTHDDIASVLRVTVVDDAGHFPRMLLIGGIKQMVAEAVEAVTRIRPSAA